MRAVKTLLFHTANRFLQNFGYKIEPVGPGTGGYIDAKATVEEAKNKGLSVCEYVETLWDQRGRTASIIEEMKNAGCFTTAGRVVEIGAGTGRYLDYVLKEMRPTHYDIYETADDWAAWLAANYGPIVVRQPADGRTLLRTATQSCELVHAHGVFVYLSMLNCFEYFSEMYRVCAPGGYIVFDFFPSGVFDEAAVASWLRSEHRFPVVLPGDHVLSYFGRRDCDLVHEFDKNYGEGYSHYFIFRRKCPPEREQARYANVREPAYVREQLSGKH
jgi:SAM-dependent methyltransferase